MTEQERYESEVLELVQRQLEAWRPKLTAKSVKAEASLLRSPSIPDDSEISIYFWRHDDVVDVLEFHLYRGGSRVAEYKEVDEWLPEQLEDVVSRLS
jgi:hypothetical protein